MTKKESSEGPESKPNSDADLSLSEREARLSRLAFKLTAEQTFGESSLEKAIADMDTKRLIEEFQARDPNKPIDVDAAASVFTPKTVIATKNVIAPTTVMPTDTAPTRGNGMLAVQHTPGPIRDEMVRRQDEMKKTEKAVREAIKRMPVKFTD